MAVTAQLHDGTRLEFPDGTDPAVIQRTVKSLMMRRQPAEDPTQELRRRVVADMNPLQAGLAGAGKALADIGRGAGQMLGLVPQSEIDQALRLDSALMESTAGRVGNVAGNVALAVPTAFVPGANTLTGAALTGAVMGALQPVSGDESRLGNAAIGGAAGAGGVAAGRALAGLYQGGKALVEPFTEAGRAKIAGRTLQRFADDPTSIVRAAGGRSVTGATPTLAEVTGDAGVARLQDAARSMDPQIAGRVGQRLADNNAARVQALQSLAGDSAQRASAEATREAVSRDLYQQATRAAYTVDDELQALLSRPAVKQAMGRAQTLAENQGRRVAFDVNPGNPFGGIGIADKNSRQITGQALQDLKMAMDEMLTDPASGFTGKSGDTIKALRGKLLDWMEGANPAFKAARTAYREASKPINAMDIGEEVARRATSNTSDLAGNPRMQANALLGMMRDEPRLIARATGRSGAGNALSDIMTPDQVNLLRSVAGEADRAAAVSSAGAGPGSATAQRLASQNILRQLAGPTGLPESWAESAIANTVIGKPLNLVYGGVAEPKIQQAIADALLDPSKARDFLVAAQRQGLRLPDNIATRLAAQAARVALPAAVVSQPR